MNWAIPYPCRLRSDSVRRINMSSEPGSESFLCALRPILRILSLRHQTAHDQRRMRGRRGKDILAGHDQRGRRGRRRKTFIGGRRTDDQRGMRGRRGKDIYWRVTINAEDAEDAEETFVGGHAADALRAQ